MNILITGVAGFIGFHAAFKLLKNGINVYGIDNINDYYSQDLKINRLKILKKFKNFKFLQSDINNINKKSISADIVIHLAAQAGVRLPPSENHKYIHSNIDGFQSVLDFCKETGTNKLIYASSSSVYSGSNKSICSENDELPIPPSLYAKTKIRNENMAKDINKLDSIGLRFFSVYGPFGRPDMAYFSFTKQILNREEITVFNNGNTSRDYTYIDDVISGILNSIKLIESERSLRIVLNLGSGKKINTLKLISMIEQRYKVDAIKNYVPRVNETKSSLADLKLSEEIIDYRPEVDFSQGLNIFFDWYDEYYR